MNNKNILVYVIAAIVLLAGGFYIYQSTKSTGTSSTQNNTQSSSSSTGETQNQNQVAGDSITQPEEPKPLGSKPEEVAMTDTNCTRSFDENKLKTAKVNIANQFISLDIKGFGIVKVQLYDKDAPKTVENFLRLVNSGFYDCLTFHRVSKGFVIQGGDPNGNGTGGISVFGDTFEDELNSETPSYKAGYKHGVLAMANRGPNTNSSQFFILLSDYPLDHKYTIFGKVTEGLENVDKIGKVEIVPGAFGPTDGAPKEKVIIQKATIIK